MSQAPLNCLLLLLVRASFKSTGDLPAELCLGIMHTYAESILSEPKGIAPRHKTVWYSLNFQDWQCYTDLYDSQSVCTLSKTYSQKEIPMTLKTRIMCTVVNAMQAYSC